MTSKEGVGYRLLTVYDGVLVFPRSCTSPFPPLARANAASMLTIRGALASRTPKTERGPRWSHFPWRLRLSRPRDPLRAPRRRRVYTGRSSKIARLSAPSAALALPRARLRVGRPPPAARSLRPPLRVR